MNDKKILFIYKSKVRSAHMMQLNYRAIRSQEEEETVHLQTTYVV